MKALVVLVGVCCSGAALLAQPSVQETIKRSAEAMEANWKQAPNYSFLERDVETKHGHDKTIKTYRVFMIDGSQYNQLVAINDQPLTAQARAREAKKLENEIRKRNSESQSERERRIAKYRKERQQDHALMKEMVNAFDFKLAGEEIVDGHKTWVFDATPKPGYQPINSEARVLPGMRGRLWVDQPTYQWVKVSAEVVRPIAFFGFLAKVQPGTRFTLEQAPVTANLWLPKRFSEDVNATALGFLDESSTEREVYSDYKPMPTTAQLLASAGSGQN